jgi:hypothetical protein
MSSARAAGGRARAVGGGAARADQDALEPTVRRLGDSMLRGLQVGCPVDQRRSGGGIGQWQTTS